MTTQTRMRLFGYVSAIFGIIGLVAEKPMVALTGVVCAVAYFAISIRIANAKINELTKEEDK
jgi:uncharacterized membrane protein